MPRAQRTHADFGANIPKNSAAKPAPMPMRLHGSAVPIAAGAIADQPVGNSDENRHCLAMTDVMVRVAGRRAATITN